MSRSLWRADAGASTVEFAFVAGILFLLLLGVLDFGLGFWTQIQVGNAARAGAEYAVSSYSQKGFDSAGIQASILNAVNLSTIQASPAPTQTCGCPTASGIASASCTGTCAGGAAAGFYVTVRAQAAYSTIFGWPGISNPITLTAMQVVRVK